MLPKNIFILIKMIYLHKQLWLTEVKLQYTRAALFLKKLQ